MYELRVERCFNAAHAITIAGQRESTHGHDWGVTLVVEGTTLSADGLLCDFHDLERELDRVIQRLDQRDLNATPPFDRLNPTAEHVARHIARTIEPKLPQGVRLASVSVTEAPGCTATVRGSLT